MRIIKALTTLLASAALTGSAWGAAIDHEANVNVVRAPPGPPPPPAPPAPPAPADPEPDPPGPAIDEKIRQYCGGYLSKRDLDGPHLYARATPPGLVSQISPGDYDRQSILGLWTQNLVTCTGIAIVGNPQKDRGDSRFMYHTLTVQMNFDSKWNEFANHVRAAELKDARAVISVMHLTEKHPVRFGAIDEDMQSTMDSVVKDIKSKIKDLIGEEPKVEYHYGLDAENGEGDAGTMQIDMSNKIFVDGREV